MDKCELCGKSDEETDLGDFNGVVLCYPCAKKDKESWKWMERENKRLGLGLSTPVSNKKGK